MNTYERYECFSKGERTKKNMRDIFLFCTSKTAILGSQVFIMFINLIIRTVFGCFRGFLPIHMFIFMNIMNTYEVMVFKRFFKNFGLENTVL